MLEVLGRVPEQPDSCVFALVEAADPEEPITVRGERGGCGGGKGRVVIDGRGRVEASALGSPTHLLVRCTAVQGSPVTVLVERGSRGIPTWPAGDLSESQIEFRSARTAAESVLTGTV